MRSLRARIALIASVMVLAVGALAFVATDIAYRAMLGSIADRAVLDGQMGFDSLRTARAERLAVAIEMLTGDAQVRDALVARDRQTLLALTWPRFERLRDEHDVSRMFFVEPDAEGSVFLRTYLGQDALDASAYGDPADSSTIASVRASGSIRSGFELGRSTLSLRVVAPFPGEDGEPVGYVALSERLHDYLTAVSAHTGDEYALFIGKSEIEPEAWATLREQLGLEDNWDDYEDVLLVDTTLSSSDALADFIPSPLATDARRLGFATRGRSLFADGVFPIADVNGDLVGEVFVRRDLTTMGNTLRRAQLGLVLAILVLAILAAAGAVSMVEQMVFKRLDGVVARAEAISLSAVAGEWEGDPASGPAVDDEIGRFERFFGELMLLVSKTMRSRTRPPEDGG